MKEKIKKLFDESFLGYYFQNREKISELPDPLRNYLRTMFMTMLIDPATIIIILIFDHSDWATVGSILLMGLIIEVGFFINYVSKTVTLLKGEYKVIEGPVIKVTKRRFRQADTKWVNMVRNDEDGKSYLVYVKGNPFSLIPNARPVLAEKGLILQVYAPAPIQEEDGLGMIYYYYSCTSLSLVEEEYDEEEEENNLDLDEYDDYYDEHMDHKLKTYDGDH